MQQGYGRAEVFMLPATIAHYRIIQKLGPGGMGEVYLAEDTRLDRQVAIKVLPAPFANNADRRRRFTREAQTVSALSRAKLFVLCYP